MKKRSSKRSEVKFTEDGVEDVRTLPKKVKSLIKKEILKNLVPNPYNCSTELREPLKRFRSFRVDDYRVIFTVHEQLIVIVAVGKRKPQSESDVYKKLENLVQRGKLAEKIVAAIKNIS